MDYSSVTFGLDVLVSVIFGAGGAAGVYFTMKGRIDLLELSLDNFKMNASTEISNLKNDQMVLRGEYDQLVKKVDENQKQSAQQISELKEFIMQMKVDIIQEIHNKK